MTTTIQELHSDEQLKDTEHHFRVESGPGAGKTHWLVNHVRSVARNSKRLTPCSKIGVISYTNVAVREILRRLGTAADAVEVSTIHSFLFRNLVRPYAHLLKASDGTDLVAHQQIDTHTEHYVSHTQIDAWLTICNRRQLLAQESSLNFLKSIVCRLVVRIDSTGSAFFVPREVKPYEAYLNQLLSPERLMQYKRCYWVKGTIDHEDVLYFAFRLLAEFPILRQFLSARFPYLFIDEFQDTLPVQAALVRWLAAEGTVVGVIGDAEQAVYGFVDASPDHFRNFSLPDHSAYVIRGNRRSTAAITKFLNHVRTDSLQQDALRSDAGSPPTVYAGELHGAIAHARANSTHSSNMLILARSHKELLQARATGGTRREDPWDKLEEADSARSRIMLQIATAVDLAQRGFYDLSIQRLVRGISTRDRFRDPFKFEGKMSTVNRRSLALSLLEFMTTHHGSFQLKSALDVYKSLTEYVPKCLRAISLPAAVRGKFKIAAEECLYGDLVVAIRTAEETRLTRTIHQAKGSQAMAVFVILNEDSVDHILNPKPDLEEQRITYVALSRAQDELYFFCPVAEKVQQFESLGVNVISLQQSPSSSTPKGRKKRT